MVLMVLMVLKRQVLTYASLVNACLPCVAKRGKRASKQHLLYLGVANPFYLGADNLLYPLSHLPKVR
jgi:hypothetical protein